MQEEEPDAAWEEGCAAVGLLERNPEGPGRKWHSLAHSRSYRHGHHEGLISTSDIGPFETGRIVVAKSLVAEG